MKIVVDNTCGLCKKNKAKFNMRNTVNGNLLKCCEACFKSVWGSVKL